MHWEHRMPAHSVIFVRSGKTGHRRQGRTDEVTAGNYVFMRRDCSVNVTKVPLDGKPYLAVCFTLPRKELKEYYNRIAPTCKLRRTPLSPDGKHPAADGRAEKLVRLVPALCRQHGSPFGRMAETEGTGGHHVPARIDARFYPTLFDFSEAWKIDLLDFMEQNYTEDMTLEEFASYTGRSLATFKRDFAVQPPPPALDYGAPLGESPPPARRERRVGRGSGLVGFKNRSHFSPGIQRKRYGCT